MHYNKRAIFIGVLKAIAFMLIFLILFNSATDLFRTKSSFYEISPIYELPRNSVDVLLLGTSHMNCTISPMDLWKDYGITSFSGATSSQPLAVTYFILRELLKVQRPKVVVLECYHIIVQNIMTNNNEQLLHHFVDNVPFSSGVHEAIQTLIQEDHNKMEYYLNFYSFHNRWKELSKNDFKPSRGWNRGAATVRYPGHALLEAPTIVSQTETEIPPKVSLEYLYKIIELSRDEGIPLVFRTQPFIASANIQKMLNYIGVVAEEENIPYLNFFYLLDGTGFDFTKDISDNNSWNHVNYSGAKKFTSYLGEYLQTNYNLPDHRTDPAIADLWNEDYETFARELNNIMMKTAANTDEYFNYLQNQDYVITWNANSETPLSETALPEFMKSAGIKQPMVRKKQYYNAVTRGGEILYRKASGKRPVDSYMTSDTLFSFGDGIIGSTNPIGVHVGKKEYSIGNKGLNLAVYDPVSRTVVDSVNIDLETGEIKRK